MQNADTATLLSFDPTAYTAVISPDNSVTGSIRNVPVAKHVSPALLVNGARVIIVQSEFHTSDDTQIVGVQASGSPVGANPNSCCARVYNSAAISIPSGVQTTLTFNSKRFDNCAAWPGGAANHLAVSNPGLYVAWAGVEFASNPTGERTIAILDTLTNQLLGVAEVPAVNGDSTDIQVTSGPWIVGAPTTFQALVFQNSGVALNLNSTPAYTPEFGFYQVG